MSSYSSVGVRALRRSSEFVPNGVKVVCSSRHTGKLQKLQRMSLYDNMLTNVKARKKNGISVLWRRAAELGERFVSFV